MHSNIFFLIYEYQPFFLLLKIGAKTSFILNSILFLGGGGGVLGPLDPPPRGGATVKENVRIQTF